MLQVGGEHDAVMAAAPGCGVVTLQVVPGAHPTVALPVPRAAGAEDVQVSGGFGTMQPWTSTAVAVMVCAVPLLVRKLVSPILEPTCREMH
jgi:hypothetical protein